MDDKDEKFKKLLKTKIAEHIGVEVEDVKDEDIFGDDLHMSATEFSDFLGSLAPMGVDAGLLDISTSSSVEELFNEVSLQIAE
jgi:hypothetical protein